MSYKKQHFTQTFYRHIGIDIHFPDDVNWVPIKNREDINRLDAVQRLHTWLDAELENGYKPIAFVPISPEELLVVIKWDRK